MTGGASGIGQTTALIFARDGVNVVIADVTVERGEETVQKIRTASGEAIFVKTDVSQAGDVNALVNTTVEGYGRLCSGLVGFVAAPHYTASKHGVVGLAKTARWNTPSPVSASTRPVPVWSRRRSLPGPQQPGFEEALVAMEPMGRVGRSEEIGEAVVWLC